MTGKVDARTLAAATTTAPATCPFTIAVDSREQQAFAFAGFFADGSSGKAGRRPLVIPTVTVGLKSGDYSIIGFEDRVAVERKGLADLYGTLGQGRGRFTRELERLATFDYAAVVVEADWQTILYDPPERGTLSPLSVFRSVVAWQQRHTNVHWWPCPGRGFAERVCFRILERWWKDHVQTQSGRHLRDRVRQRDETVP